MRSCSGHLFGFSGLDGPTNETVNFVSVFGSEAFTIHVCLKERRDLSVKLASQDHTVLAATGDVLIASVPGQSDQLAMVRRRALLPLIAMTDLGKLGLDGGHSA